MEDSNPPNQETVGDQLIEDISQLQQFSLGEGAAKCLVCGSSFGEGDTVVVYVFRPADETVFQVGYVLCAEDRDGYLSEGTLGVRELLVEGRVGVCTDGATQSSWPVLLAPEILGVSAASTKSIRWCASAADQAESGVRSAEGEVGR
ncbi:hypothetical protein [Natranaeroarchaeum sulfidigenes]|uniref:DUF8112 domain-containing protein n=1 Tax=Natranaeroarchaeum sulfidigenes TaxID=2784880 RepID=A0A897MVD2_9EURY|nr:hypothetical protein [Natranaeroarchaeum sulfidigenes]QSG02899.1 Uncharacterized protein AArcS_1689 [Natranaeroarchaeum sulfidigenes]